MHLLGFRFAPRIRDMGDTKLFIPKGEANYDALKPMISAHNALARAVFFNRLGELRDRGFEQQRYRASGLNLLTAVIVLWNTVYLEQAVIALRNHGQIVDETLLQHLSPLGWEHINLTGDYLWRSSAKLGAGKFRPLRPLPTA